MKRLILFGLALVVAGPLAAQERSRSPHGDLALECRTCHRPEGWTPVEISKTFDHAKFGLPLTGAHQTATCRACHQSLDFKGVKSECTACHTDVHRGELGPSCGRCHNPSSFLDHRGMIRMHQLTRFRLEGAHLAVDCTSCHTPTGQGSLQFVARSADCVSCHQTEYTTTKNPDHVAGGFPTNCDGCHTAVQWTGASFNHNATGFPLVGAHLAVQCAQCHVAGRTAGTPTACVACHLADYNGTTSPAHSSVGYPQTCQNCHPVVAGWLGATGSHTSAVTISATHGGSSQCSDCHSSAGNFAVFQCYAACHHTAANTDRDHTCSPKGTSTCSAAGYRIRNGTTYVPNSSGPGPGSTACYTCHPRGSAG